MRTLLACLLFTSSVIHAEEAVQPEYVSEAPLPKDWPAPGPYNKVTEKKYPEYRVAVAEGGSGLSFWTLFNHIQKNDIPMTAPVEMGMATEKEGMKKTSMGFLYQNTKVGETGADGKKVEVKDVKEAKVLSYTWMGDDSKANIETAKKALDAALAEKEVKAESFRLLGYNGPGTPRKNHTYELQALLPKS